MRRVLRAEARGMLGVELAWAEVLLEHTYGDRDDMSHELGDLSLVNFTGTLRDVVNGAWPLGRDPVEDDVVRAVRAVFGDDARLRGFVVCEKGTLGRWHGHGAMLGPASVLKGCAESWHRQFGYSLAKPHHDLLGWLRYCLKVSRHAVKADEIGRVLLVPDCQPF